jgi:hypothetical protein
MMKWQRPSLATTALMPIRCLLLSARQDRPGGRGGSLFLKKMRRCGVRQQRGNEMACQELIDACFDKPRFHFATTPETRIAAADYLRCCLQDRMRWLEVEQQIRDYLGSARTGLAGGAAEQKLLEKTIDEKIDRARSLLRLWMP